MSVSTKSIARINKLTTPQHSVPQAHSPTVQSPKLHKTPVKPKIVVKTLPTHLL